mmetsp:Transcript_62908/g.187161  ORF Transcript_62908/g.187161 Transcript_62908/m.187161 type:complete len:142 (+) Transcript_62908:252-677(+)
MGARLAPLGDQYDPHHVNRIWLPDKDTPGIAMSRSFGDTIATTVGVISEPAVTNFPISQQLAFVIIASDGIWEVMSSQEAVDLASRALHSAGPIHSAVHVAVRRLAVEASRRWMHHEHLVDDITVIMLIFDRSKGSLLQTV